MLLHFTSPATLLAQDVPVQLMETLQRLRTYPQQNLKEIFLCIPFQHLPSAALNLCPAVIRWHLSVFLNVGILISILQTSLTSLCR